MLPRMMVDDVAALFEPAGLLRLLGDVRFRVSGGARSIVASPDGARYATVGGGALTLLDAASGAPLRRALLGEGESHEHLAIASDGVLLFASGWSANIGVYDARSLARVRVIETGYRNTMVVASCPGAPHILYSGGFDRHSSLRDLRTGRTIFELPHWEHTEQERGSYVHAAVFSPDGARLVTITYQGADLWDVASGEHLARVADESFCPSGAAFSPEGEDLFLANNRGRLALINPRTGTMELDRQALPVESSVHAMMVTPDGESLVCCAENGVAYVFHPSNFKLQRALQFGRTLGTSAALAADGDTLVMVDEEGCVVRASVSEGAIERPASFGAANALAFVDDDTIVTVARTGVLARLSLAPDAAPARTAQFGQSWQCALSPRGARALLPATAGDRTLRVIDTSTMQAVSSVSSNITCAVSDEGLVAVNAERGVLVGEASERIDAPTVRGGVPLQFSYDGSTLLARAAAELCRIDLRTRSVRDVAKVARGHGVCSDRLGRVVIGAATKVILLGDEASGAAAETFVFKGMNVGPVACSPDGALIAAGTHSGYLLLMKRGDPTSAIAARVALGGLHALGISPDGTKVALSSSDPQLRVYDVAALFAAKASSPKGKGKGKRSEPASSEAPPAKSAKKGAAKKKKGTEAS